MCRPVGATSSAPALTFGQFQEANGDDVDDAPASPPEQGISVPVPTPVSMGKRKSGSGSASSYEHVRPCSWLHTAPAVGMSSQLHVSVRTGLCLCQSQRGWVCTSLPLSEPCCMSIRSRAQCDQSCSACRACLCQAYMTIWLG